MQNQNQRAKSYTETKHFYYTLIMIRPLTEVEHITWDEFLTDLRDVCAKHHVLIDTDESGEIWVTDLHNGLEKIGIGTELYEKALTELIYGR